MLNVPGSATVSFEPSLANPSGWASGTVVMCLDEASAVQLEFSHSGGYSLTWGSDRYVEQFAPSPSITPVLPPGCGMLTVGISPCSLTCEPQPNFMTVTATKV